MDTGKELQHKDGNLRPLSATPMGKLVTEMCLALSLEIEKLKSIPSKNFDIFDGNMLHIFEGKYIYHFRIDSSLPMAPETPINVFCLYETEPISGTIISVEDFGLYLALDSFLGDYVEEAKISSDPWFILLKLHNRLKGRLEQELASLDLQNNLLGIENQILPTEDLSALLPRDFYEKLDSGNFTPNQHQRKSIEKSLRTKFHLIWGPPGTGKTLNLAQTATALALAEEKILVLAHSNVAIDVALLKIHEQLSLFRNLEDGKLLRAGIPQMRELIDIRNIIPEYYLEKNYPELVRRRAKLESIIRDLSKRLTQAKAKKERTIILQDIKVSRDELAQVNQAIKEIKNQLLRDAQIVGTTLSLMAVDDIFTNWSADAVIIDEISMANFPMLFEASFRAKNRLLMFGDFRQLSPIYTSNHELVEKWLSKDAFEISGVKRNLEIGFDDPRASMLKIQYRMSSKICELISNLAYNGKLITDPSTDVRNYDIKRFEPFMGEDMVLVNTSSLFPICFKEPVRDSHSRINPIHSALAISLAHIAINQEIPDLGIITPYKAQSRLIYEALNSRFKEDSIASVATIHRFQGAEKSLIIFDITDSFPMKAPSKLTGKSRETALRLFNVGLSRAMGKLILIADLKFIYDTHPADSLIYNIINSFQSRGAIIDLNSDYFEDKMNWNFLVWFKDYLDLQDSLAKDLLNNRERVLINFPENLKPFDDVIYALKEHDKRHGELTIFAPYEIAIDFEETNADVRLLNCNQSFFASIGEQILYFGSYRPFGGFAKISDPHFSNFLLKALLGNYLYAPPPCAETQERLTAIMGKCRVCGKENRLIRGVNSKWIIGCVDNGHPFYPLSEKQLQEIIEVLNIRCPVCKSLGTVVKKRDYYFMGCPNYTKGCQGRLPGLGEFFGGI